MRRYTDISSNYLPLTGGTIAGNILPNDDYFYTIGSKNMPFATMYAGSFIGDLDGLAERATKLGTSTVGGATTPIYLDGGEPKACTYTLGKSVPSNAVFTDTIYSLPTASSSTLGGVKTTSTVTSTSGLTACPIISGVPYYKDTNTTYSLSSFGLTATATEINYCDGVTSNIQTQLNTKSPVAHVHEGTNIQPAAIEIVPATNAGHGGYIDFHYNGNTGDYTSRIMESSSGVLSLNNNKILTAANITALYNISVTFSSGKATYSNSLIKSSSVCIVQRRSGTAGSATTSMYATTTNNGSITIVTDSTSATSVNLNIFIFNL